MGTAKIQDKENIPPTQTLTPDTTASEQDYQSVDDEPLDSIYLSKVRHDLPSPPLQEGEENALCHHPSSPSPSQELKTHTLPSPPPSSLPLIKESTKWCQRCGTISTPRWRFGPAGSSTLCNACHLRWKVEGRPDDGYSSSVYPPPFFKATSILPYKRKSKQNVKIVKKAKKQHVVAKQSTKTKKKPIEEKKEIPVEKEIVVHIPGTCANCKTTETPLWRKGPLGNRTLCNACGLKWAKSLPNNTPKEVTTTITKQTTTKKTTKLKNPNLLHNKKDFIKQGLYYDKTRIQGDTAFTVPLPIHQGEFFFTKERNFELPPDIHQEREMGLIKGLMADRQPFFTRIRSNIFVERKPSSSQEAVVCHCVRPPPGKMGCGDDCINRMLFYECDPKYCPCGDQCSNRRFQRKERTKRLQVFQTDSRGWGLRTLVDIKKGDLVIEYRGEVISHELCEERMCTTYVNEKNFYFLEYCNGEVIDACTKGTEARFINHSCEPNCHIEKWSFRDESHFGVFASQDIMANSELFYDYNFSTFNNSVESEQVCYCGSQACRGTIGRKISRVR